ncbi:hypothetical protein [Streptomyces prunicolor]|uniref:hypothetical protein n=1 Tax=Streptomyces prunicolor TaxID=67348 RepID=UPI000D0AAD88|nr:hypothetical protein [Streptomyces prunicolor]
MSNRIQNHVPAVDTTTTGHLPYAVQAAAHPADTTTDAREHTEHTDDRITLAAAGLYAATCAYDEALRRPNPAATLDNMCDAVHEIAPDLAKVINSKASAEFAEGLRVATVAPLWAFAAIEHARVEAGDGYGYVFDLLVDGLKNGVDPDITRKTALDVPRRLRENAEASA